MNLTNPSALKYGVFLLHLPFIFLKDNCQSNQRIFYPFRQQKMSKIDHIIYYPDSFFGFRGLIFNLAMLKYYLFLLPDMHLFLREHLIHEQ